VFRLVWWAWTEFTWALTAADTTHPGVELATLAATAVAFFVAVSLPGWFSLSDRWWRRRRAGQRGNAAGPRLAS
jgi:hypothetical protein